MLKYIKKFENFQSVAVSSMYDTGASGSFNSVNTFLKNVELEEINNALMYDIKYTKEKLKSDWSVKFFRIKKRGIDAFIFVNSAIEYIFKKD
jgi:hypothetical protein